MRRSFAKLGIYLTLVAVVQVVVAVTVWPRQLKTIGLVEAATDVMILGDSVSHVTDPTDTDKRGIHEFLRDILTERDVAPVIHNAYHLRVHEACARYIAASESRPGVVVMPINLRSFSASWYLRPAYRFEKLVRVLEGGALEYYTIDRPLKVFKVGLGREREEYQATPVYDGERYLGKVSEISIDGPSLPPEGRRDLVAYMYLYPLTKEHRLIRSIGTIATTLREAGVTPVFYLTPIDHELATRWYGPEFRGRVAKNVALIKDVLREHGLEPVDMLYDLGAGSFTFAPYPHEHMKQDGREHVARRIARAIRALPD